MRKIYFVIALLTMVSSCKIDLPRNQSTSTVPDVAEKSEQEAGQQTTKNSRELIRDFENQIASTLISNFSAEPTTQIPLYDSIETELTRLDVLITQLSSLNRSLLSVNTQHAVHQINMRRGFRQRELDLWLQTNHLNHLDELLPPAVFQIVDIETLDNITNRLHHSAGALNRLQTRLEQQNAAGIHYPDNLLAESLQYIQHIGEPGTSVLLSRYRQILDYSNLESVEQQRRFEKFQTTFFKTTYPAYLGLSDYLNTLLNEHTNPISTIGGPISLEPGLDSNADSRVVLSDLHKDLKTSQQRIQNIETNQSLTLRQIYSDPRYSVKNQINAYQLVLNLVSIYVLDVEIDLLRWFSQKPTSEAIIAENDRPGRAPFVYHDGVTLFDLATLIEVPIFELEALAYQYVVPGQHLLDTSQIPYNSTLLQAYRDGWSSYAPGKIGEYDTGGEYFADELSMLGLLVRSRLTICKAVADLNIQLGNWSAMEAQQFIADNTPYSTQLITREVNQIIANPGLAFNGYMVTRELRKLHTLAISSGKFSPRQFHSMVLIHSPAPLEYLREDLRDLLEEEF
ncbi:MAG: DUF885 family protein [bacterium]|nr:DUF885 family protein [Gammaproteobacteria bacterium]HIL95799.1 DUF885 family protein [Pseudomonadales bacterium]